MKYYSVTCKHGHHGAKNFCPITFAIEAETISEACDLARAMPGVKHDQTVISCKEISPDTYWEMRQQSAYERAGLR